MADEVVPGELDITDELIAERRAEEPGETPEDMTPWQRPIVACIDVMNLWAGRIVCLLLVPLIFVMVFEVFSRTMFGTLTGWDMNDVALSLGLGPTLWAYDLSRMSSGVIFMAAAGYALLRGVHIRADFLYRTWTKKTQATTDASLYLLFYFPAMLFFFWTSADFWWAAFQRGETTMDSTWAPVLWPARLAMPVGAALLFLQGISELFRAFYDMGKERERMFVKFLPVYIAIVAVIFLAIFFPDAVPFDDWFNSAFGGGFGLSKATIGLLMLGAMLFSIFVGFPISFTLIFLAFTFGSWGAGSAVTFFLMTLQVNSTMLDDQLVAVPLFILMGIVMEQAGLMERLFNAVQLMMSRTRGALFIAVLFVSTIFAAATGIVGASVTILGIMAAKTMNKSGYDVRLAAGTITAGGTLGILIPPSIMLIVMGPVLEIPVTELFRAAIMPGVILAGLYMLYALGRCWINPKLGPILPEDEQPETSEYYGLEVLWVFGSLGVLIKLIYSGATGQLSYFPVSGLIIPLLWTALMFFAYSISRSASISGKIVEVVSLVFGLAIAIFLIWNFTIPAFVAIVGGDIFFGIINFLPLLLWLLVIYKTISWERINGTGERFYFSDLWYEFFMGLVPPTVLIAFALGSILAGWATPAEASACGAFGAILLSLAYRKLTFTKFYDALIKTLEISVLIMFLVAASNFFGAVFSNLGTPKYLTELLLSFDLSVIAMLIFVMALVFLLGWPLEWVPIVLIIIPILVPLLVSMNVNLTWFAILVAVNLQTAWLSPPVALSAYFLKGVVPEWDLKDIYFGMMQFMCIQVLGLSLMFAFPGLILWFPDWMAGNPQPFFSYTGWTTP
ncbi:TRAP transporter large permease subunit [Ahrensia sp. R2A130]|uniref:TRAP transporter large permease subunit n=1 Tax=Ahrensia sp. R2A130 TaxID=744979 RepID=UPI0001E0BC81|nr:TRAP transporter large permease subunit [Ahrensia sp. R2A130]EFL88738.1 trap dicarboxylate transporter, dctm subunit [Ahrensia sp. R2A130]